jgi:transposase-like protein
MANIAAARKRMTQAGWRRHIKEQAHSGLSIAAYCRRHGLREHGYYWWRRELARRDADQPAAFVPVTVATQPAVPIEEGRIEIVLPDGRRVRVMGLVDKGMLADVLAVLAVREEGVAC